MVGLIADINMLTQTSMERGRYGVKNTPPCWLLIRKCVWPSLAKVMLLGSLRSVWEGRHSSAYL